MKSGVNESFSEIQPFGVCMEYIGRAAFFQMLRHSLKGGQQKCIKLLVLHAVILYGQTAGTLKRNAIGRIGQNEICLGVTHESRYILRRCGIATHQLVSANCPDVATLYKCSFFQCSGEVKIIVFHCVTAVCIKQICNFSFIKASQTKVKTEILQFFHFHSKEFFIPAGI